MHFMFLGFFKLAISCLIRFVKVLDMDKLLLNSITKKIESLAKLGIDAMPKEMIKYDEWRIGLRQIVLD